MAYRSVICVVWAYSVLLSVVAPPARGVLSPALGSRQIAMSSSLPSIYMRLKSLRTNVILSSYLHASVRTRISRAITRLLRALHTSLSLELHRSCSLPAPACWPRKRVGPMDLTHSGFACLRFLQQGNLGHQLEAIKYQVPKATQARPRGQLEHQRSSRRDAVHPSPHQHARATKCCAQRSGASRGAARTTYPAAAHRPPRQGLEAS